MLGSVVKPLSLVTTCQPPRRLRGRWRRCPPPGDDAENHGRQRCPCSGDLAIASREGGCGVAGVSDSAETACSTSWASPISRRRRFGSFSSVCCSSRSSSGGAAVGSLVQSGSRETIADSVSVTVSPANGDTPVSISYSTQPNAQMSDRLSTGLPRACSGLMKLAVPRITPVPGDRGDGRRMRLIARRGLDRFGEPEVEHFNSAVGAQLDVGGLQVPVDDPLRVRRVERIGDLRGDWEMSRRRKRSAPCAMRACESLSLDQFERERTHWRLSHTWRRGRPRIRRSRQCAGD